MKAPTPDQAMPRQPEATRTIVPVEGLKTASEVSATLTRCELLLRDEALLSHLDNNGESLKQRYVAVVHRAREMNLRVVPDAKLVAKYVPECHSSSPSSSSSSSDEGRETDMRQPQSAPSSAPGVSSTSAAVDQQQQQQQQRKEERQQQMNQVYAYMEAHKDDRPDLRRELMCNFSDTLCRSEVDRLVAASSPKLLLTWSETQDMMMRHAEMEEEEALRRLQRRLAALQVNPDEAGDAGAAGAGLKPPTVSEQLQQLSLSHQQSGQKQEQQIKDEHAGQKPEAVDVESEMKQE